MTSAGRAARRLVRRATVAWPSTPSSPCGWRRTTRAGATVATSRSPGTARPASSSRVEHRGNASVRRRRQRALVEYPPRRARPLLRQRRPDRNRQARRGRTHRMATHGQAKWPCTRPPARIPQGRCAASICRRRWAIRTSTRRRRRSAPTCACAFRVSLTNHRPCFVCDCRTADGLVRARHAARVPAVERARRFESSLHDGPAVKAQMPAKGYVAEGYGPDAVAFCALP